MPKRTRQAGIENFTDIKKFSSVQDIDRAIEILLKRIQEIEALQTQQVSYSSQLVANVESSIRNSLLEIFGPRSPEFGEHHEYRLFYPERAFTTSRQFAERLRQENQERFLAELPEARTMMRGLIDRLQEQRSSLTRDKASTGSSDIASKPTNPPSAFVSYSHDGFEHRDWVAKLGARLRHDGVEAILDQWELVPGDQLPEFMERAVRENKFVLIICTPRYKERSDARLGGVGYEGDIMTAEVCKKQNHRKFIPILRSGQWSDAAPSWLSGKYFVDLSSDPYSEEEYRKLLHAIHETGERPPLVRSTGPWEHSADYRTNQPEPGPSSPSQDPKRSRAAGRDVLSEAIANVNRVLSAEATTLRYEIADGAWRLQRHEIALLLDDDLDGFRRVVGVYDSADRVSAYSREWNPFEMSPTHEREAKDLLLRHAEEWFKAVETLKGKVLAPSEAAKVDAELGQLRNRLVSARQIIELDRMRR